MSMNQGVLKKGYYAMESREIIERINLIQEVMDQREYINYPENEKEFIVVFGMMDAYITCVSVMLTDLVYQLVRDSEGERKGNEK